MHLVKQFGVTWWRTVLSTKRPWAFTHTAGGMYRNSHSSTVCIQKRNTSRRIDISGLPLAVQWLKPCAPNTWGTGSLPGQGTKIPHAAWWGQKKKVMDTRLWNHHTAEHHHQNRNHSFMLLTGMSLKVKSGGEIEVKSKNRTYCLRKYTWKMEEEQE